MQSYNPPYFVRGHVEAPVAPYVTHVADLIGYTGAVMIVRRGPAEVRIRTGARDPKSLQALYVPVAVILRGLGATVSYDAHRRVLQIEMRTNFAVGTMRPSRASPVSPLGGVFTPEPIATPRPVYTGSPHPRRTPVVRSTSRP
ncbi:MAG: hypothetical protein NVS9B12_15310 [Vulcanimicrobiaceae bacterium]